MVWRSFKNITTFGPRAIFSKPLDLKYYIYHLKHVLPPLQFYIFYSEFYIPIEND